MDEKKFNIGDIRERATRQLKLVSNMKSSERKTLGKNQLAFYCKQVLYLIDIIDMLKSNSVAIENIVREAENIKRRFDLLEKTA